MKKNLKKEPMWTLKGVVAILFGLAILLALGALVVGNGRVHKELQTLNGTLNSWQGEFVAE